MNAIPGRRMIKTAIAAKAAKSDRGGTAPAGKAGAAGKARPAGGKPSKADRERARPDRPQSTGADPRAADSLPDRSDKVETLTVAERDGGQRLDRWFRQHFPDVSQGYLQKLLRTGQVRVDGKRVEAKEHVAAGALIRVPRIVRVPKKENVVLQAQMKAAGAPKEDRDAIEAMILYEDDKVLVLNKPFGLAVQGGTGTRHHIDGMLAGMIDRFGDRPRLVHRIDRDTTGILLVAKTRDAAAKLGKVFQTRSAAKTYWALVNGVPKPPQGKIEQALVKGTNAAGEDRVRKAEPGEQAVAMHATTHYSVIDRIAHRVAWVSLKPVTGRQHQLRAHMAMIGHPIVGDPKYQDTLHEGRSVLADAGVDGQLHLHARRLILPHPDGNGKIIDVTAPLPEHMKTTWEMLGLDEDKFEER
jgi:23S rRNA pseudouridine955/2504/2580 synthase